jgi:hypothetical protein
MDQGHHITSEMEIGLVQGKNCLLQLCKAWWAIKTFGYVWITISRKLTITKTTLKIADQKNFEMLNIKTVVSSTPISAQWSIKC